MLQIIGVCSNIVRLKAGLEADRKARSQRDSAPERLIGMAKRKLLLLANVKKPTNVVDLMSVLFRRASSKQRLRS
jgi:hypothetical protein